MTERVKILADQIRGLDPDEQADLAHTLGWVALDEDEPDGTPEEVEAAWAAEVERRIAARERGETQLVDFDDAIARARARLKSL